MLLKIVIYDHVSSSRIIKYEPSAMRNGTYPGRIRIIEHS